MDMFRRLCSCWLLALMAAGTAWAKDEVRSVPFAGWVELDAAGKLAAFAPDSQPRVPDALVQPLVAQVRKTSFVPASIEGRPAPARSWLQGTMRLVPDGDRYLMHLEDMRLGPRLVEFARLPTRNRHPSLAMVVAFHVLPDGSTRVNSVRPLGKSEPEVLRGVAAKFGKLRYEPEQVAGVPVETRMLMPLQIHRGRSEPEPVLLEDAAMPPGRPGVAGQGAHEPLFLVRAELIGSGSLKL